MGGSSSQTIGQRYFAKLTTFIGNPIDKLIGINFDNRGWIYKPHNDQTFLRVESQNLYGDKEGGVAGYIDIQSGTADQLPNTTYSADFPKVSGYPFQSYLLFRGLGKGVSSGGVVGEIAGIIAKRHHYNNSFYHGNSGYMKEMLLWPQRIFVRNDGREQWYKNRAEIDRVEIGEVNYKQIYLSINFSTNLSETQFNDTKNNVLSAIQNIRELVANGATIDILCFFNGSRVDSTGDVIYRPNVTLNELDEISEFVISAKQNNIFYSNVVLYYHESIFYKEADERIIVVVATDFFTGNESGAQSYLAQYGELLATVKCKTINNGDHAGYLSLIDNISSPGSNLSITDALYLGITSKVTWGLSYADLNPIHKIREILTDDTAMNKLESDVNEANFKKAADRIWNENLGISWSITEKSCLEAINELCGHIEAGVRMNRQTGLYEMVLFRDDWFDENEIHTLPVNKIKSMQLDGAVSADELINKLNVSYYNREAIKNSSFSIAENASIRNLNGHENAEEVKFPYFMNQRNSAVVGQWKLKQMSTPVWQGTFTTGFYEARKWNRYDLLKLAWPKRWSGTILVRIMKINLGTTTDVSVDFVEVIPYSADTNPSVVIDTPVDTTPRPPQPALFKAFELSYLEAVQLNGQKAVDDALAYNPDAGYAAVISKRPQVNSMSALMYTDMGTDYERVGAIAYCETAMLDQHIIQTDTAFIVKNAGAIDMVNIGTQITLNSEIMVFQSFNIDTGLLTVKRGALDTIPQGHSAGSMLYFADDFITIDPTEYVRGELVNVKALTTTPSGILNLTDVMPQQVKIQARAIRPYPPANVKINDEYWPAEIEGGLNLTWVDRNRLQQTGGSILGWFDGGVTPENGVTYMIELYDAHGVLVTHLSIDDVNYATVDYSAITTSTCRIKLYSMRDGYSSSQAFEHELIVGFNPPYNINAIWNDLADTVDLAWDFDE